MPLFRYRPFRNYQIQQKLYSLKFVDEDLVRPWKIEIENVFFNSTGVAATLLLEWHFYIGFHDIFCYHGSRSSGSVHPPQKREQVWLLRTPWPSATLTLSGSHPAAIRLVLAPFVTLKLHKNHFSCLIVSGLTLDFNNLRGASYPR